MERRAVVGEWRFCFLIAKRLNIGEHGGSVAQSNTELFSQRKGVAALRQKYTEVRMAYHAHCLLLNSSHTPHSILLTKNP